MTDDIKYMYYKNVIKTKLGMHFRRKKNNKYYIVLQIRNEHINAIELQWFSFANIKIIMSSRSL